MDIESLIDKVLRNKASKEEIEIVENWKAETKANLNGLKQMQTMLKDSQDLKSYKDFDKKSAWNKIEESIEYEEVKESKSFTIRRLSVAAIFIFLLAASYFMFASFSAEKQWVSNSELKEIILDDGSKVWLNKNSTIYSLSDFVKMRKLSLEGEAFFDVTHFEDVPFIVKVGEIEVEVLGTEFNIKKRDSSIQIYVNDGVVKVSGVTNPVILTKGQMIDINKNATNVYKSGNQDIDLWRFGKLVYKNFPLKYALKEIGDKYGVNFTFENILLNNCQLNSSFENETIKEVLEELKLVYNMDYKLLGRNVEILSIKCD